jgi:hypothetical protein
MIGITEGGETTVMAAAPGGIVITEVIMTTIMTTTMIMTITITMTTTGRLVTVAER